MADASRHFRFFLITTIVILQFGARAFGADNACRALFSAKPEELLALAGSAPDVQFHNYPWLSGITCTWEGLKTEPPDCDWRTTIVEDRKISDDRRLLVASFARVGEAPIRPSGRSADEREKARRRCFIFGCIGGQIERLLETDLGPQTKIQYASADRFTLADPAYSWASHQSNSYWVKDWGRYTDTVISPEAMETPTPSLKIPCKDLPAIDQNRLMLMEDPTWHGTGCYSLTGEDPNAPDAEKNDVFCDQTVTIERDQMIGENRRLVDLRTIGTSAWSGHDEIYVFGCVSGLVKAIFDDIFNYVPDIDSRLPEKLTLSTGDCGLPSRGGLAGCPTREIRLTYMWNAELNAYLLRSAHISPFGGASDDEEEEPSPSAIPSPGERNKVTGAPIKSSAVLMPAPHGN